MKKIKFSIYLIFVITFVSTISLSNCPESKAKYFTNKSENFSTNMMKVSLTGGPNGSYDYNTMTGIEINDVDSTYNTIFYRITFNKNKIMYNVGDKFDKKDSYLITMKSDTTCSILSNVTTSGVASVSMGGNELTIDYATNEDGSNVNMDDTITFNVSCDIVNDPLVDDSLEYLNIGFDVKEKIQNYNNNDDSDWFTYLSPAKENFRTIAKHYSFHPIPSALYDTAISQLQSSYSTHSTEVEAYFNSAYENKTNSEILFNQTAIEGFSATDNGDGTFTTTFNQDFLGYALTYYNDIYPLEQIDGETSYKFYISDYADSDVENTQHDVDYYKSVFQEYLSIYASPEMNSENNKILKSATNNYNDIFNGNVNNDDNTLGITVTTSEVDNRKLITITFTDAVLDIARNRTIAPIPKVVNGRIKNADIDRVFDEGLYRFSITDDYEYAWEYYDNIVNSDTIMSDLKRNSLENISNNTLTPFSSVIKLPIDYLDDSYDLPDDATKKAVINIFSSGTGVVDPSNPTYTYFNICEIGTGLNMSLAYLNNDNGTTTKEDVLSTINELQGYDDSNKLTNESFSDSNHIASDDATDGYATSEQIPDGLDGTITVTHNKYKINDTIYDLVTYSNIPGVTFISYTQ